MTRKKPVGWRKEPVRHGLAAKGIKTGRKPLGWTARRKFRQQNQELAARMEELIRLDKYAPETVLLVTTYRIASAKNWDELTYALDMWKSESHKHLRGNTLAGALGLFDKGRRRIPLEYRLKEMS